MATGGVAKKTFATQQGIEDGQFDYYDIMVIGKSGVGKTTTADKLLVANPLGYNYQGTQYSEPLVNGGRVNVEDLSIWLLSGSPDELPRVKTRLKNIAFVQGLENLHEEINGLHGEDQLNSGMTPDFELISNESTRVRVLDVPGFFGEGDAGTGFSSSTEIQKATNCVEIASGRMRNILRLQTEMSMKFKRVLYFLPTPGALKRSDSYLETELSILSKYFARSIFNCMIVITTMPSDSYDGSHVITFSDKSMTTTKENFNAVLSRVFRDEKDLPQPPFLFISMAETCETILANVQNTRVTCESITFQFDTQICARCRSKTKIVKSERVSVYTNETESSIIPYEESTCHPLFVPKYTDVVRFIGGIVYVFSFHAFFKDYLDEVCVECKNKPLTRGCTRVKTKYELKGDYLMVDHTSNINEPIKYEEREPSPQSEPSSALLISSRMVFLPDPVCTSSSTGGVTSRESNVDRPPTDPYSDIKG